MGRDGGEGRGSEQWGQGTVKGGVVMGNGRTARTDGDGLFWCRILYRLCILSDGDVSFFFPLLLNIITFLSLYIHTYIYIYIYIYIYTIKT